MKIFFLLNPSLRKKQWDYREMAARITKRHGWTPRFGEVDRFNPHSVEHLLRQAREEDCSRIGVVGGDGTLHAVINALYRDKQLPATQIAVIPAGTCNDFARYLGLHRKRLEEAFKVACAGKVQPTDLALMGSELFINNAGIGRRPLPQTPTKPLRTLRTFKPIPLQARWEKGSIEGNFFMALACNAPYFSGGLHFSKSPVTTDGQLDIYLIPATRKWRLIPLLIWGRLGRPVRSRHMINLKVQSLDIRSETDIWPQADGEPAKKAVRQVEFSVVPEKAMIVFPV